MKPRNDDPTNAEIDRSQAMLAAVLGPEEVAKLDEEAAAIEAQLARPNPRRVRSPGWIEASHHASEDRE